jgi:hypothetical protein
MNPKVMLFALLFLYQCLHAQFYFTKDTLRTTGPQPGARPDSVLLVNTADKTDTVRLVDFQMEFQDSFMEHIFLSYIVDSGIRLFPFDTSTNLFKNQNYLVVSSHGSVFISSATLEFHIYRCLEYPQLPVSDIIRKDGSVLRPGDSTPTVILLWFSDGFTYDTLAIKGPVEFLSCPSQITQPLPILPIVPQAGNSRSFDIAGHAIQQGKSGASGIKVRLAGDKGGKKAEIK